MAYASHDADTGGQARDLTVRVAQYARLIEKVVLEVGEHPDFEMKRECSISSIGSKIEFVKDVQSIATSRIETEKFLIIGADDQLRQFQSVANVADFDQAKLQDILAAYLDPVPVFEVFDRETPDGSVYVFLAIPRQPTRLIFAKATVGSQLRQGDLWTKGTGTAKRLATHSDFMEIMDDLVEARVDERVRVRVDHAVELALVRQNVANDIGIRLLPPSFDDGNFKPLMETLCASGEDRRFKALLERLRDDLVASWGQFSEFGNEAQRQGNLDFRSTAVELEEKLTAHYHAVFRPAMRWLTLAGLLAVKNEAPTSFIEAVSELLKQTYEVSHALIAEYSLALYGLNNRREGERFSHMTPAIDAVTASHIIGAYVSRRERYEYFRTLTSQTVHRSSWQGEDVPLFVLALWPVDLNSGFGESALLRESGGRIKYCVRQARLDPLISSLFGSELAAVRSMCEYELCLELNSWIPTPTNDAVLGSQLSKLDPKVNFYFDPAFYAYSLNNLGALANRLYSEAKSRSLKVLKEIVWESFVANAFMSDAGRNLLGEFFNGVIDEQKQRFLQRMHAFAPLFSWSSTFSAELNAIRKSRK